MMSLNNNADLSALLAGNANGLTGAAAANPAPSPGGSAAGSAGAAPAAPPAGAPGAADLSAARNSALLNQLMLQQQAQERQKLMLQQQLSALGGLTQGGALDPNLALLLQQQSQLQGLAGVGGFGVPGAGMNPLAAMLGGAPGASLGAAGLGGIGQLGAPNLDTQVALAKLLQGQQAAAGGAELPAGMEALGAASLPLPPDRRRKGRTGTFPQKLHQMLSDLEAQEGGTDIASFLAHGRAFAIHKPRDFVKHVMPKYFRMSRFSSFQRQLNLYDFQRITEGPDKGAYFHELFVQGRPILSTMMKRNKIKGVKNQQAEKAKAEEEKEKDQSKDKEHSDSNAPKEEQSSDEKDDTTKEASV